jgi:hypothetical protein
MATSDALEGKQYPTKRSIFERVRRQKAKNLIKGVS